ncbi:MAG TPA: tryptophan 2,3-dioxygenase family protein [Mycobacteriales bacterium]|nr:tryptophan 2,3-dioxygenase family protein [Mycobacteriales bacterium]
MEERGHSFGEEGGRLSYGSYLRVDELLAQQVLASDPPAHDELLFITVHQVYELWFKQLLHELTHARDTMVAGETYAPRHALERSHAILRVLVEQVGVLETMTPQDFLAFRSLLAPASGFQSVQFREMEFLSGKRDPALVSRLRLSDAERERLDRRLAEPTLWDGYCALLASRGLAVADEGARRASLLAVARDRGRYGDLWDVAEGLVAHDELVGQWRARHVDMVERQIGTKSGTGGSTGAPYLRRALGVRFFPELWELRSYL